MKKKLLRILNLTPEKPFLQKSNTVLQFFYNVYWKHGKTWKVVKRSCISTIWVELKFLQKQKSSLNLNFNPIFCFSSLLFFATCYFRIIIAMKVFFCYQVIPRNQIVYILPKLGIFRINICTGVKTKNIHSKNNNWKNISKILKKKI